MKVSLASRTLAVAATTAAIAIGVSAQAPKQPPVFRSAVEVTSLDASVVDNRGQPITDLSSDEFTVQIDGAPRRVVSAEFVSLVPDGANAPPPALPDGYSTNEGGTAGRLIVLVVDQPNIRFGGGRALTRAAEEFLDTLQPADRVAVVGFGLGARSTAFLSDRERSKQAIASMHGQMESLSVGQSTTRRMALSEALAIDRGDDQIRQAVVERECGQEPTQFREECAIQVVNDARMIALQADREGTSTIRGLHDLLLALAPIDAPKTLVLMTEGFIMEDGVESPVTELGGLAASARTSIYVLKLDDNYFDITEPGLPFARGEDTQRRTEGVMALAAASRGAVFNVVGTGQTLFDRIAAEISGYYLLGVESAPTDRDGRAHSVRVRVSRGGATVRARRSLLDRSAFESPAPRTMSQEAMEALTSPLLSSALPLHVITFSLRDADPSKVQLLIRADIGGQYTADRQIAVAYVIADEDGHDVQSLGAMARVGPVMNGVPSPLQYAAGASLPPGDYRLKIAVAEGDRVGSVEHEIHAGLVSGGDVDLSDLMVGGPVDLSPRQQPTVTPTASFGVVQGYLEAYGPGSSAIQVRYEVASTEDGPPILGEDAAGQTAGPARTLFSRSLSIRQLPPGAYRLRAAVFSSTGEPLAQLSREFDVAPPSVLMSSVTGVGSSAAPDDVDLFLPVEETDFASAFHAEEALERPAVDQFRAQVEDSVRPEFDAGVKQLQAGNYEKAEESFKHAIQPDVDSTSALVYLAATFAASGHDQEAAGAWQTALIEGGEIPEVYYWLAEALLRTHDLNEAREILAEATGKWPSDPRLTHPLAMLYATFGQGREAVRTMERYLDARPDDQDALLRAVEWIYNLRLAGAAAHTPEEDTALARRYAESYQRANGPQGELVRQWMTFLESPKQP